MLRYPKSLLFSTCGALFAILPVLKVSAYVFDFSKDVALTTGVNKKSTAAEKENMWWGYLYMIANQEVVNILICWIYWCDPDHSENIDPMNESTDGEGAEREDQSDR